MTRVATLGTTVLAFVATVGGLQVGVRTASAQSVDSLRLAAKRAPDEIVQVEKNYILRMHGDTVWSVRAATVTMQVERGDTIWVTFRKEGANPSVRRYVVRGDSAFTVVNGREYGTSARGLRGMRTMMAQRQRLDAILQLRKRG